MAMATEVHKPLMDITEAPAEAVFQASKDGNAMIVHNMLQMAMDVKSIPEVIRCVFLSLFLSLDTEWNNFDHQTI